ncbi:LacI family DNA-binding transcriptional regulator [Microbacterium luticocti]|uniref:LacI family DNA-binding transcriptional regulator n=1 Tax=Microbacterium luticocti TaxID=451764 RepID=UPI000413FABC|nr:LacI family DNA-binding transcriptional regulator [Microbacterium luticocti]
MPRDAPRPTIRDVALAARVSTATVSQAFNPEGRIAAATRAHVLAVAERLGYQPSSVGRALRTGRTGVLGVVPSFREASTDRSAYLGRLRAVTAGVVEGAAAHGCGVVAAQAGGDGRVTAPLAYDGLVLVDPMPGDPVIERALHAKTPVVTVFGAVDERDARAVRSVAVDIAAPLVRYLDRVSQTVDDFRPAIFVGSRLDAFTHEALRSFQAWCAGRGVTAAGAALQPGETAADGARRLLGVRVPPTVVVCLDEPSARAVRVEACGLGMAVPDRVRVAAVGDAHPFDPAGGVDVFAVDAAACGVAAAEVLAALIGQGDAHSVRIRPADPIDEKSFMRSRGR